MKAKKFLGIVLAMVLALSLAVLAACGGAKVNSVKIDKTSVELVATGSGASSAQLTATLDPKDAKDEIKWSVDTNGSAIVSLSANSGSTITVTAKAAGSATITAAAGDKSATCTVTVKPADITVNTAADLISAVANAQNEGKSIFVKNGTYNLPEQVRIAQDITIIGESEEGVILQPANEDWEGGSSKGYSSIITVTNGADASISNMTVKGARNIGNDYAHGINLAQAGTVTISNVTSQDNDGVGVLVNDSVAVLNNVATSGNGWGGVNVDVIGRDWTVPATVLTVDQNCEFAEQLQIYCDEEAENTALQGKISVPSSYNQEAVIVAMPTADLSYEYRYVWSADETLNGFSKLVVAVAYQGGSNLTAALQEMNQDNAALYMLAGEYNGNIKLNNKNVTVMGVGDVTLNGYIEFAGTASSDSVYTVDNVDVVATDNDHYQAIRLSGNVQGSNITLKVKDSAIKNFEWGLQIGGSAMSESKIEATNVAFENVWCALSVGYSSTNSYTAENCTFEGCKYQLQEFDFEGGQLTVNNYYKEIDGTATPGAEAGSAGSWYEDVTTAASGSEQA